MTRAARIADRSVGRDVAKLAATALRMEPHQLAGRLGVSLGTLKHWGRRSPPPYAKLALAAVIMGIDAEKVFADLGSPDAPAQRAAAAATPEAAPAISRRTSPNGRALKISE